MINRETFTADKYPLSDFQKEILKKELDLIDNTLGRIDTIQMSLKNWCIVIWGGSLYLVTEFFDKSSTLFLLTALIPALFGYLDLLWKRQILKATYREEKISEFLNAEDPAKMEFRLLDPIGISYKDNEDFKSRTGLRRAFGYKGEGYFYLALVILTVLLWIFNDKY